MEKNGEGFIAKVSLEGKIVNLRWVTGLDAPKGMALIKDKLYVTDIDRLVEIDVAKGKVIARYPFPGAKFLNDVVADAAGDLYVSDMAETNSVIYRWSKGEVEVWAKGPEINMPNGLYIEGDQLVVGNSGDGTLKVINLHTKQIRTIAHIGMAIDGLRGDGEGNYIISDWRGKTSLVTGKGEVRGLLDTTAAQVNAADLEYIKGKRLLLIPTFFDNRVVAYRLQPLKR